MKFNNLNKNFNKNSIKFMHHKSSKINKTHQQKLIKNHLKLNYLNEKNNNQNNQKLI